MGKPHPVTSSAARTSDGLALVVSRLCFLALLGITSRSLGVPSACAPRPASFSQVWLFERTASLRLQSVASLTVGLAFRGLPPPPIRRF